MGAWEIALSALVGGLVAALISIWYQYVSDKIKNRKYIIITVTEWIDSIYTRLQALSAHKENLLVNGQKSTVSQEYRTMNNEMRILLLSNKIIMEVACEYGEGNIMQKVNKLRDDMLNAARIFWNAQFKTWKESKSEIEKTFHENIDPLRASIMDDFFNSTKELTILGILKKRFTS